MSEFSGFLFFIAWKQSILPQASNFSVQIYRLCISFSCISKVNGSQSDKDERMKAAQFVMKLKVPEQLSLKKRLPFGALTFYSVFNHNIVIARNEVGLSVSGPMCFEFLVPSPTFIWRMIFLQWAN